MNKSRVNFPVADSINKKSESVRFAQSKHLNLPQRLWHAKIIWSDAFRAKNFCLHVTLTLLFARTRRWSIKGKINGWNLFQWHPSLLLLIDNHTEPLLSTSSSSFLLCEKLPKCSRKTDSSKSKKKSFNVLIYPQKKKVPRDVKKSWQ